MKKLIVCLSAIAFAVGVQAGTVTWGSGTLYTAGTGGAFTTTEVANGDVTGYLWMIDAATYNGYSDTYGASGYSAMSSAIYNDYKDSTATASKTGSSADGAVKLTDGKSYSNGTDLYSVVLYTMTQGGTDYYIANIGDFTAKTAAKTVQGMGEYELGDTTTSGTSNPITGWTAVSGSSVPEPTSGLLMLVGLGALALRRRRA